MSFVEAFYSFNLQISNTDSGVEAAVRVKPAKHPYESLHFFYARLLAFCHAYTSGLRFSQGLFAPEEPTIWNVDELGLISKWVEVGALDSKKLKKALKKAERAQERTNFCSYMFLDEHVQAFCAELRGSKENWIAPISFLRMDPRMLDVLCETHRSSARWQVTVVDSSLYLDCDGTEVTGQILPIDMWQEFQRSINNSA